LAAQLPKKLPPSAFQTLNEVTASFKQPPFTYFVKGDRIGRPSAQGKFYRAVTEKLTTNVVEK
jgi:hypothetical protein